MRLSAKTSAVVAGIFCVLTLTADLRAGGVVYDGVSATLVVGPPSVRPGAVYSNVTTNNGVGLVPGGAPATGPKFTRMIMDDITTTHAGSFQLGEFTYTVGNFDFADLAPTANVRFFAADGANGAPGTFLGGFNFNAMTFNEASTNRVKFDATAFDITLPSSFWAGAFYTFDASVTQTRANRVGQGAYNPVDVGSSQDKFFWTTEAASSAGSFQDDNVSGAVLVNFFNGSPVANLGWEFSPVPEPGALSLSALALPLLRRRR